VAPVKQGGAELGLRRLGQLRFTPGQPPDELAVVQQVTPLFSEQARPGRVTVPGIQNADAGKFTAEDIERGKPGTGMPVGGIGMRAMEGQVASERDGGALVRGQDEVAVGMTFCWAYLANGEGHLVELNLGAVG
jgi:hypothetical protein